jgi:hypothetical protein
VITLTPRQAALKINMDAVEIITDRTHGKPVELADWLAVLMHDYGADAVVDEANAVADKVQQEAAQ